MRWKRPDLSIILLSLFVGLILISGCANMRVWTLDLAQSDTKNAQALCDVSDELMHGWPTWSGFLKGLAKERMKDLPVRVTDAWNELDLITCCVDPGKYPTNFCASEKAEQECAKFAKPMSDYTKGYYSGTRVRMLVEGVIEGFKQFLPDLVGKLPADLLALL
jgi:uncharacterized protein YceK